MHVVLHIVLLYATQSAFGTIAILVENLTVEIRGGNYFLLGCGFSAPGI
jgi:hypothetical protein